MVQDVYAVEQAMQRGDVVVGALQLLSLQASLQVCVTLWHVLQIVCWHHEAAGVAWPA